MLVTQRTTLAAELQAVMANKGATEWAKDLDVDRTTVHKWWSGDAYPRGKQLEAIAKATGRQLRFVPDTTKEPPPKWVEALRDRIVSEVQTNREMILEALAVAFAESAARQLDAGNDDEGPDETEDQPPRGAGPKPKPAS